MEAVELGEGSKIVIANKDRLVRFGFDRLEYVAKQHNCKIGVINQAQLSPQQEMVEDLRAIIHCVASRLYGLRS